MTINNNLCICTHPNGNPYIEMKNNVHGLHVQFVVKYMYGGQLVTKKSDIFGYEEKKRVYFKASSSNITVEVFENPGVKPESIFHINIFKPRATCFIITGPLHDPNCTEIPC